MNPQIVSLLLDRAVDLAHVLLGAYFVKRSFDFLTARFAAVGAEPVIIERRDPFTYTETT